MCLNFKIAFTKKDTWSYSRYRLCFGSGPFKMEILFKTENFQHASLDLEIGLKVGFRAKIVVLLNNWQFDLKLMIYLADRNKISRILLNISPWSQ